MRLSGRESNELRRVSIEPNVSVHAEGSCVIRFGNTQVMCTASLEDRVPPFIRNTGLGWVTAEYGMLPRATNKRNRREATAGRPSGRTAEIQRLIGRSLRACVDRVRLGERQLTIDCDVIQADGGTRCASITGGWVALRLAVENMLSSGILRENPITEHVAAVSCGIVFGQPVLDLDYAEDSEADADANFVLTGSGDMVEIQCTAETVPFSRRQLDSMLALATKGVDELVELQTSAVL